VTSRSGEHILKDLLFVNAAQVVTCAGPDRARKGSEMREAGILKNAAVAVSAGPHRRDRGRA